ncbi:hypothetical protein EZ313_09195 [Ramlibacter henchirensis]|uniref:Uncharacterized protein n=1 Tax=Ramlibacter henchirensis TaxID=204072 RepID=A0A4Z0C8Q5_9BURK|nr:hypothetical protein [Ramlibacter henchirensis]TFZ06778.1 hypothetical protein EZ313_09195 [Ramlibacter henchirensis]
MSLLRWFSREPAPAEPAAPGSSARDAARPAATATSRRDERNARREKLYGVVRDTMVNAGVLSSSYRFKVLSLDGRGRQFLVMVDLAGSPGGSTADLARIEVAMAQNAKARHDIVVKSVYWREAPSAATPRVAAPTAPQASRSTPAAQPLAAPAAAVAAAAPATAPVSAPDPLLADEVAAFKQALAQGTKRPRVRSFEGDAVQGPQSYTLLTGFEDTETASPEHLLRSLSNSQHGDLR